MFNLKRGTLYLLRIQVLLSFFKYSIVFSSSKPQNLNGCHLCHSIDNPRQQFSSTCNFDNQLSSKFHRLCTCGDTSSEKSGLWQLSKVSCVFKMYNECVTMTTRNFELAHLLRCPTMRSRAASWRHDSANEKVVKCAQSLPNV